jgi:hypothetical protein
MIIFDLSKRNFEERNRNIETYATGGSEGEIYC